MKGDVRVLLFNLIFTLLSCSRIPLTSGCSYSTCDTCLLESSCGWCQNLGSCVAGSGSGPISGTCGGTPNGNYLWDVTCCPSRKDSTKTITSITLLSSTINTGGTMTFTIAATGITFFKADVYLESGDVAVMNVCNNCGVSSPTRTTTAISTAGRYFIRASNSNLCASYKDSAVFTVSGEWNCSLHFLTPSLPIFC